MQYIIYIYKLNGTRKLPPIYSIHKGTCMHVCLPYTLHVFEWKIDFKYGNCQNLRSQYFRFAIIIKFSISVMKQDFLFQIILIMLYKRLICIYGSMPYIHCGSWYSLCIVCFFFCLHSHI